MTRNKGGEYSDQRDESFGSLDTYSPTVLVRIHLWFLAHTKTQYCEDLEAKRSLGPDRPKSAMHPRALDRSQL